MENVKRILLFLLIGFVIGASYYWLFQPQKFDQTIANLNASPINKPNFKEASYKQENNFYSVQDSITSSRRNAITQAIDRVFPSVVGINVKSVQTVRSTDPFDAFFGRQYRQYVASSIGSGFVISRDGYIITNHHVIDNAQEIGVTFANGKKYIAKKIGSDSQSDIALIKIINADGEFRDLEIGDSDDLIIGEWAIALGNPFGLNEYNNTPTVTLGIISAIGRDFGHLEGEDKVYHNMIQTDAAINSGNSGGPLVNALGQVIGMNTFIYTGSSNSKGSVGIAFSIPINDIMRMAKVLKNGDIDRNYYSGLRQVEANNDNYAAYLKAKINYGAIITQIDNPSPAYKSGLRRGDIIIEYNGYKINTSKDLSEAYYYSGLKVGDLVEVKFQRGDDIIATSYRLEKSR